MIQVLFLTQWFQIIRIFGHLIFKREGIKCFFVLDFFIAFWLLIKLKMVANKNVMASMLVFQVQLIIFILILRESFLKREKKQNSQSQKGTWKSSYPVIKSKTGCIRTFSSISLRNNGLMLRKRIITVIFHLFQLHTPMESDEHLISNAKKSFRPVFMSLVLKAVSILGG